MAGDKAEIPLETVASGLNNDQFGHLFAANAEASRLWMAGIGQIMRELVRFSGNRMQQDMRLVQQLYGSHNPNEAVQLQVDSLNEMVRQYMEETQRVSEMMNETGACCLKSIDNGVRVAADSPHETTEKAKTRSAA